MQHNVTDTVLNAFSRARAGVRWQSPLGFSVVALQAEPFDELALAAGVAGTADRHGGPTAADLIWREAMPPSPGRLRAHNPETGSIVVDAGGVIDGGMSMRVVAATVKIPAGAEVAVAVDVLGARWWNEGRSWWRGGADPVVTALALQSFLGVGAVASSARTAIRSLTPFDSEWTTCRVFPNRLAGWLLLDEEGILAGRLSSQQIDSPRIERLGRPGGVAMSREPRKLHALLRDGVSRGDLEAHLVGSDPWARDVVVIPQNLRLVDQVVYTTGQPS